MENINSANRNVADDIVVMESKSVKVAVEVNRRKTKKTLSIGISVRRNSRFSQ